jgi:copper(I)-binding protein
VASKKAPMTLIGTQQTAGRQARAGAPRLGSAAGAGRSLACSWHAAALSIDTAPIAFATKPASVATAMYIDVPNHRTRRLWEPSP